MDALLDGILSPTFNGADLWGAALLIGIALWWNSAPADTDEESTDE